MIDDLNAAPAARAIRARKLYPLPAASVLGIPTRIGPFRADFFGAGKCGWAPSSCAAAGRCPGSGQPDESIGAFMTRRFGREATFYLAATAGIHAETSIGCRSPPCFRGLPTPRRRMAA